MLLDFVFNVLLKLCYCITVSCILCKFVIKFGKLNSFDLVKLDLEDNGSACKFGSVVFSREGYIDVEFVTNVVTNNLFFEAGNELAGAKLEFKAFALAAFKCNAVLKAFEVDNGDVAVSSCAVGNGDVSRISFADLFDFGGDFIFGYADGLLGEGDAFVAVNGYFGLEIYSSSHNKAVFVDRADLELGLTNNCKAAFFESAFVSFGKNVIDGVFVKEALAKMEEK